jgi:phosphoglycolate phosphatase-like HAD superfamily hydrolase
VCDRYTTLLRGELAAPHRSLRVLDGVSELLDALDAHADALVGLLTGNVKLGAEMKLSAVGLDVTLFRVGAYGSDAADRSHLPPIAVQRAEAVMGREPQGSDVVIIGDTPADVACGRGIGARAIAVATGPFNLEQLRATAPYAAFLDLTDATQVMAAIFE